MKSSGQSWILYVVAALVVVAAAGAIVWAIRGRGPGGCTGETPYGLSYESYTGGGGNPDEDLDMVVPTVSVIAQVTVTEDLAPAGDGVCDNGARPSHTVKARVDEILYSDLPSDQVPTVGSEIEITTVDTMSALSADPKTPFSDQIAVVAISPNRTNPLDGKQVPWLAYGRSRVTSAEFYRESWDQAIAATKSDG